MKKVLFIFGAATVVVVGLFYCHSKMPSVSYMASEKITNNMKEMYKEI